MKLRLERGSVRIRLSRDEVEELSDTGELSEALDTSAWTWTLTLTANSEPESPAANTQEALEVRFEGNHLVVTLPRSLAAPWLDGSEEGVRGICGQSDGPALRISVETDRLS